jgi:hypothetical protein
MLDLVWCLSRICSWQYVVSYIYINSIPDRADTKLSSSPNDPALWPEITNPAETSATYITSGVAVYEMEGSALILTRQ